MKPGEFKGEDLSSPAVSLISSELPSFARNDSPETGRDWFTASEELFIRANQVAPVSPRFRQTADDACIVMAPKRTFLSWRLSIIEHSLTS